jgi:hypothetical protein
VVVVVLSLPVVVVVALPPSVVVVISSLAGVEQPPSQRTNDQDTITEQIPIINNQIAVFFIFDQNYYDTI